MVLIALFSAVVVFRDPLLRGLGGALVVDEPVEPVEIIVVPQWTGDAGAIDAADLIRSGIAGRVAVLPEPPKPAEGELARRGIHDRDKTTDMVRLLGLLGVSNVEVISNPAASTEAEGEVLLSWCHQHQFRIIVVVSAPDHSRRVRRVLDRSFRGHPTKILVRSARYAAFDPNEWWKTRDGIRTGIVELQKLLLDFARHPLS